MAKDARRVGWSSLFVAIAAMFVTLLIVSNVVAVKLVLIAGFVLPAAVVVFPLSYIFGDVLTEVYGYGAARRVIWLGFLCNLLFVAVVQLAQALPAASFWPGQAAFEATLGVAPRILLASFAAYLVGEFANAYVLARLKIATRGRHLWVRTIGSTIIGQALDSAVFITLAFAGTPDLDLPTLIVTQWLFKTLYEAIATPLTYLAVNAIKRAEGVDVYDRETDFNPLAV